jgi:hypothetical protein
MGIEQNTISRDWTVLCEGRRFFVSFTAKEDKLAIRAAGRSRPGCFFSGITLLGVWSDEDRPEEKPPRFGGRGSETTRGLVDLLMPVGHGLMRLAVQVVKMMPCPPPSGDAVCQGSEAGHQGESGQNEENGPHIVWGQSLGQNVKDDNHLRNLLDTRLYRSATYGQL